ncbi:MAG: type II toxin-antitoxin system VapC family toxin [Candidatus Thermoplasmatota archaeon]
MVRTVLDTGVFFYPTALERLRIRGGDVVIPAVALAERVRQLRRDGRDEGAFMEAILLADYRPESLSPAAACAIARTIQDDAKWRRLSRDAFIAAHVQPGDELWTTNPKDFRELGLPDAAIVLVP